ncbi:MAG TPA: TonB-dependent receptor [Arachidicoccus sp.]|nr:TonB-dependent receptor [Arachidicoccus sp.]
MGNCVFKGSCLKQYLIAATTMLLLLIQLPAFSQVINLTGEVYDQSDKPIAGASINIEGATKGTVSNTDGQFDIAAEKGATLIIRYIGFQEQVIVVGAQRNIIIHLVPRENLLDSLVVQVGYGTQKKMDLSSSISSVSPKELLQVPGGFQAILQSEVPGVQITGDKIRVRGVGSINNTDPLYVVDGMIGGSMPDENNIASIQILKDAASCAIYGARGANGVILVTTKRGRAGNVQIDYNGYGGIKQLAHNIDLLNGKQLAELINEEMYNQDPTRTDYLKALSNPDSIGKGYNMVDALLRTGNYQKHNLSISGGSNTATFRLNGSYSTDKPVIIQDETKNYGLQFISDFTKGKLKVGETFSLNYSTRDFSNKNIIDAQRWSSTLPLYDANNETGFAGAGNGTDVESALANAYLNNNNNETFSVVGNLWGIYEFIPGLKYKFNLGLDLYRNRTQGYISKYLVGQYQNNDPDELDISSSQSNRLLIEHTLSYDKVIGKHSFSAIGGITSEQSKSKGLNGGARSMPSPDLLILGLTQDANSKVVGSSLGRTAMYSMLGRVTYNYDSKYLLTANFRRDGSANFSRSNRYGNFPSFSAAWRLSQENFMKNLTFINDLKLRGSYGKLGNSDISPYQYQSTVTFDHVWYYLNDIKTVGALPTMPANPNVKWESQYSTDFGMDLSMFGDRLSFTMDYYNKKTEEMLVNVPISYAVGYVDNFPTLNSGSISNKGFEFAATYNKREGRFNYSLSANISTVKNKVLNLGNKNEILAGGVSPGGENVTRTAVGHSIGQFWGYKTDGLYKTEAQLAADKSFAPNAALGDVKFVDRNDDGILNADDKDFIGNPIPKFSYGFNSNFSYAAGFGTLDFSMIWQGSYGNDIYNNGRYWGEGMYHYYNDYASTLDRYRSEEVTFKNPVSGVTTVYPKNTDTNIPRAILGDPNHNLSASDRFVEDGSYLRLKSLTIGYTLPDALVSKWKVSKLRIYIGGKNLLTFTKYTGYDPEVASDNGANGGRYNLVRGIDEMTPWGITFANSREVFLGIQCSF